MFRRLLFVALLLETGLLLVLIPWSAFWERNYFVNATSTVSALLTNPYTRGAITGLGLINVWAALAELADLFGGKSNDRQSEIDPKSEIRNPK